MNGGDSIDSARWWWVRLALVLAALAPLTLLVVEILRYSVDVPYWDQWAIATLFPKDVHGHLTLDLLVAQHNESRKLFPRLLFVGLARLTKWDVRWEMAVSVVLACVVSACAFALARRTTKLGDTASLGLWALTNVLLFSLAQYENWLWGIQVVAFVPVACLFVALVIATSTLPVAARFVAAGALAFVSSYSFANGMLCWPLVLPVLIAGAGATPVKVSRAAVAWTVLYLAAFVATVVGYFDGYAKPAGHPSFGEAMHVPLAALGYFLAFLGRPLAGTVGVLYVAIASGVLLVATLTALLARLARLGSGADGGGLARRSLPWLVIAGYALASAAITTAGRLGFGVHQALESRYTSFSLFLAVAVVHLLAIQPGCIRYRLASLGVIAWIAAAGLVTSIASVPAMATSRRSRLEGSAVLQWSGLFADPHDVGLSLSPDVSLVMHMARKLDRFGYLHPSLIADPRLERIAAKNHGKPAGFLDRVTVDENGAMVAEGWAVLHGEPRLADAVLLSYDDDGGHPIAFALTIERSERDDVVVTTGRKDFALSGFRAHFSPRALAGADPGTLRAWAFDALEQRAYPLERVRS